jgi:hypothetical protein
MKPRLVRTRDEFVELLRDRKTELGLTMQTLDHITGLADGLCSKLLAPHPHKGMGALSLKSLLDGMALGIYAVVVVEDPAQAARMSPRWVKRKRPDYSKTAQLQLGTLLASEGPDNLASTGDCDDASKTGAGEA